MTHAKQRLVVLFASLVACSPGVAIGDNDSFTVDCSRGQTIADGLGKKHPDRPLTVVVRGNCTEDVLIARDDVALVGEGASITGAVTVDGARRALIAHLAITNPVGDGVTVQNGGSATIRNNEINDSTGYGIFLRNASFAMVVNNRLLRNGAVNPTNVDASGIGVAQGSMVRASDNTIGGNLNSGIEVFDNSTYRSERDTVAMGTPGRSAIDTYRSGHVDVRDVTVTGPVLVNQQSQLQSRNVATGSSFTGNFSVGQLSFLRLRAGVQRTGAVGCNTPSFAICQCDGFPGNVCQ